MESTAEKYSGKYGDQCGGSGSVRRVSLGKPASLRTSNQSETVVHQHQRQPIERRALIKLDSFQIAQSCLFVLGWPLFPEFFILSCGNRG